MLALLLIFDLGELLLSSGSSMRTSLSGQPDDVGGINCCQMGELLPSSRSSCVSFMLDLSSLTGSTSNEHSTSETKEKIVHYKTS